MELYKCLYFNDLSNNNNFYMDKDKTKEQWKMWWRILRTKKKLTFKNQRKLVTILCIIYNELSTAEVLATRRPDLYKEHSKCVWCNNKVETLRHLLTCKENKVRPKFEQDLKGKMTEILLTTRIWKITGQWIVNSLIEASKDTNIVDTLRMGILSISIDRSLRRELSNNAYINVGVKLMKRLYKEWWKLWKTRCDQFIIKEKE